MELEQILSEVFKAYPGRSGEILHKMRTKAEKPLTNGSKGGTIE